MNNRCFFRRFTVGRYPINGYLVADRELRNGVFIDPGGFDEAISHYIEQNNIALRDIFFTHGHWDHTEGLGEFQKRYSVRCHAGPNEVRAASYPLNGGETIEIGKLAFDVFSTPGHTPSGVSFYCAELGFCFSGDALFCGSVGGTESPQDGRRQIDHVRRFLFSLPDHTLVFPGHGPVTTIAAEKYGNPFFRMDD